MQRISAGETPNHQLRGITASVERAEGHLKLVHVTSAGSASFILRDGQIVTKPCQVFKKDLAYFFLCHAAYRRKSWDEKSETLAVFPVAFVIDPNKIGNPFHVYPFDTGAAVDGRYTQGDEDGVRLEDFALSQNLDEVRRFITWAFGSLSGYLNRRLRNASELSKTYEQWDFVPVRFVQIARQAAPGHNNNPDGRAATIEVAYDKHLPLDDAVRCIIVPDAFVENSETKVQNARLINFAKTTNARIKIYQWSPNDAPNWHMEQVEKLCREEMVG